MRKVFALFLVVFATACSVKSSPKLGAVGGPYLGEPPINFPTVQSGQTAVQVNQGAVVCLDANQCDAGVFEDSSGVTHLGGAAGVANSGPVQIPDGGLVFAGLSWTYLGRCNIAASGTTCTVADATGTALSNLICGPLNGYADGGAVVAAETSSCVLTQGTGWTCTVTAAQTNGATMPCFKIN